MRPKTRPETKSETKPKTKPKTKSVTTAPAARSTLFGQPQLLPGEDAAAYDQLYAHVCEAVNPVNIIDKMLTVDVVSLEWEVLRWRRLKTTLLRTSGLKGLEDFLCRKLDEDDQYSLYSEQLVDHLAKILQNNLPETEAEDAQTLARAVYRNEPEAVDKVEKVLDGIKLDFRKVDEGARAAKAKKLVQEYLRREPDAVALIQELLAGANMSMDRFMADALAENLDVIERIDRLTAIAESRRNASLHEIDRHRAVLGEALRRSVQEVEDAEFEVIETTPARGKNGH